jgi:hypothetical protein
MKQKKIPLKPTFMAGGMVQVLERLPSKHKARSLNQVMLNNNKKQL